MFVLQSTKRYLVLLVVGHTSSDRVITTKFSSVDAASEIPTLQLEHSKIESAACLASRRRNLTDDDRNYSLPRVAMRVDAG